jgi:hypothetical protein
MASRSSGWLLAFGALCLCGCVAVVVGAGAAAGTFSYVNGELTRTYEAPYDKTLTACTQILNDLHMPIREQSSGEVQTQIESERSDGTPVSIKITIVGLNLTQVSVRTGVVGLWDRDLSQQFHDFIARRLAS